MFLSLELKLKLYRIYEKFILPFVDKFANIFSRRYKNIETDPYKYKIGFAILSYERPDYLKICLSTLYKTKLNNLDITFFIIDDGSKDIKVNQIINEPIPANFNLIRIFEKKGPNNAGAAINRAIKIMLNHNNFNLIGWADPDCLFHPEWLIKTLEISLWAIKNHKQNIIGPFTSFNSSDSSLHRNYGTYKSPFGNYVVKKQAGMLNYFMFKSDWDSFGPFEESDFDETFMTKKLSKKFIRNISTFNSYVEHIGQDSVLNNWRPTKKTRAAYGINLIQKGWTEEIKIIKNLGFYKDINLNISIGENVKSKLEIEIFIPCIEKDLINLETNISNIFKYLKHPIRKIHIVSPKNIKIENFCKNKSLNFIDENSILPFEKNKFNYIVNKINRNGWIYQQLLKYSFDTISETENYLVIDADTIFTKPQVFEMNEKFILLISDEYHVPYFENYFKLTGRIPKSHLSSVSHTMLFNKNILKSLKIHIENYNKINWIESIIVNLNKQELSGFSEYETYGLWAIENYQDLFIREYYFNKSIKQKQKKLIKAIENNKTEIIRSISIHKYLV